MLQKNIKKVSRIASITIVFLIAGFNAVLQTTPEELIIGTWIPNGCETCKWVFDNSDECARYYEGSIYKSYKYIVSEEKSSDGKLTLHTLELVNISNSDEIYLYEINSIGETHMTLDYLNGTRSISNLLRFRKE